MHWIYFSRVPPPSNYKAFLTCYRIEKEILHSRCYFSKKRYQCFTGLWKIIDPNLFFSLKPIILNWFFYCLDTQVWVCRSLGRLSLQWTNWLMLFSYSLFLITVMAKILFAWDMSPFGTFQTKSKKKKKGRGTPYCARNGCKNPQKVNIPERIVVFCQCVSARKINMLNLHLWKLAEVSKIKVTA